jgi:hypothetical protein
MYSYTRFLVGKSAEKIPSGRPRHRWGTILKCILNSMGWYGLDSTGSGKEPAAVSHEHGNETSGSIKCYKILECLSDWCLLMDLIAIIQRWMLCSVK